MGVWRALPCELRSVCKSNALRPAIGYAAHSGQQMRLFAVGFKQRSLGEIVNCGHDPGGFEKWFLLDRADCCEARDPDFWVEALKGSNGRPANAKS